MKKLLFILAFVTLVAWGGWIDAEEVEENTTVSSIKAVTENDIVFFRLESYDLTKVNLPIYPYFEVYEWDGTKRGSRICRTYAREKFAVTPRVQKPSKYWIKIPKGAGKNYLFCVFSDYKNIEAAPGVPISSSTFMNWKDPNKSHELEISPGNKIVLRFVEEDKKKLYFQIESFHITKLSDSYLEKLKDHSQMQVRFSHNQEKAKEFDICSRLRNTDLRIENIPVDFEFKTDYQIEFYNKTLGTLSTFTFNSKTLFDNLKNGNEEYILKNGDLQCKLLFNGIRRIYRVKTIIIPETAPVRGKPRQLLSTEDPRLHIKVMENGVNCGITRNYATLGERCAWQGDLPDTEENLFMVREGANYTYTIYIEDKAPLFDSPMIAEFVRLTDQSFKEEEIVQKLGHMSSKDNAIQVIVEEIKTK